MSYRSLAILVTALWAAPIASADAQSVYVAGPVYVTPAIPNSATPYGAPTYAPPPYVATPYGRPAIVAPAPTYEFPPQVYDDDERFYADDPYAAYGSRRPALVGRAVDHAVPRPPMGIPNRNARCAFNGQWEHCR